MKQILIILLTVFTFQVSGQEIRPEVKKLVHKIQKVNQLNSKRVGFTGAITEQYLDFEKLREKATIDELLKLLEYENSVVKAYSAWALVDKMYPNLASLFVEFLNSGETVRTQHGCIVTDSEISSEFYNRVVYQHIHNKLTPIDSLFFLSQKEQLDSIILYGERNNYFLRNALLGNNANPDTYERIRYWAFNKKNAYGIEALAVYQKKEDIADFKKLGEQAFVAIAKFPATEFWDFLLSYKGKNQSTEYLMALAVFKTEESAKVLTEIFSNLTEDEVGSLSGILSDNYCTFYQDLLLEIWEKYQTISYGTTKQLISDISLKAAKSFSIGLLSDEELYFVHKDYDFASVDKILPLMLESIKEYDNSQLLNVCKNRIKISKFTIVEQLMQFIKDNHFTEMSDEILTRLQQKNQAFEVFHLTKTILSFDNPEDKIKVINTLKVNQKDWDWGNWSGSMRKLLKAYDIEFD